MSSDVSETHPLSLQDPKIRRARNLHESRWKTELNGKEACDETLLRFLYFLLFNDSGSGTCTFHRQIKEIKKESPQEESIYIS
jgi:hypothetical protein